MLNADIKAFFNTVDHAWMMRFLEHRIGDTQILRLIRKWLTAGVVESGHETDVRVSRPWRRLFGRTARRFEFTSKCCNAIVRAPLRRSKTGFLLI